EIEDVIREMEEIEDVSVAGIHHPKWAEFPCAFVNVRKGSRLARTDILQYVHQKLERHKLVDVVICNAPLPRNPNGKVDKSQLRKMYQELTDTLGE
ncbi:MAG: class I adenylate-forming enzyme family protein, partial [Thermoactinomyces sp.]